MFVIEGVIDKIGELIIINDKFYKKDLILVCEKSAGTQYARFVPIKFEVTNAMVDRLDSNKPGDVIRVTFDIDGRDWFNKEKNETVVFNSLRPFKFETLGTSMPQTAASLPQAQKPPAAEKTTAAEKTYEAIKSQASTYVLTRDADKTEEDDDLPF